MTNFFRPSTPVSSQTVSVPSVDGNARMQKMKVSKNHSPSVDYHGYVDEEDGVIGNEWSLDMDQGGEIGMESKADNGTIHESHNGEQMDNDTEIMRNNRASGDTGMYLVTDRWDKKIDHDDHTIQQLQNCLMHSQYVLKQSERMILSESDDAFLVNAKKYRTKESALIKISKSERGRLALIHEWNWRKYLNSHVYTMNVIDLQNQRNTLLLIREGFPGKMLKDYLNDEHSRFTMHEFLPLALRIVETIRKLHEADKVFHLNLNLESIYYSEDMDRIKITDWAFYQSSSKSLSHSHDVDFSPLLESRFGAPELAVNKFDERSDVYSLGIVYFYMLFGSLEGFSVFQSQGNVSQEKMCKVSQSFVDLIFTMVRIDTRDRIQSMEAVEKRLKGIQNIQMIVDNVIDQNLKNMNPTLSFDQESVVTKPNIENLKDCILAAVSKGFGKNEDSGNAKYDDYQLLEKRNHQLELAMDEKNKEIQDLMQSHQKEIFELKDEIKFLRVENVNTRLNRGLRAVFGTKNEVLTTASIGPLLVEESELGYYDVSIPKISEPDIRENFVHQFKKLTTDLLFCKRKLDLRSNEVELLKKLLPEDDVRAMLLATNRELESYRDFIEMETKGKANQSEVMSTLAKMERKRTVTVNEQSLKIKDLETLNLRYEDKIQELEKSIRLYKRYEEEYREAMTTLEETHKELESKRSITYSLSKDLKEFEKALKTKNSENQELTLTVKNLKQDLSLLQAENSEKDSEISMLENKLSIYDNEIKNLKDEVSKMDILNNVNTCQSQKQKLLESNLKTIKMKHMEQVRMNETLKLRFKKDKDSLISQYEVIRRNLEEKVKNAVNGSSLKKEQIKSLQQQLPILRNNLMKSFDEQLAIVLDRLFQYDKNFSLYEANVQKKVKFLIQQLNSKEESNQQNKMLLIAATEKLKYFIHQESNHKETSEHYEKQLEVLSKEKTSIETQVNDLQNKLLKSENKIHHLESTMKNFERQTSDCNNSVIQYKQRYEVIKKENTVLAESNEELRTALETFEAERDLFAESEHRLKESLSLISNQVATLTNEKEALEESVNELEELLTIEKDESVKLNMSSTDLEFELSARNSKLASLQEEKEKLEIVLKEKITLIENLSNSCDNLQNKLNDRASKNDQLELKISKLKVQIGDSEREKLVLEKQLEKETSERKESYELLSSEKTKREMLIQRHQKELDKQNQTINEYTEKIKELQNNLEAVEFEKSKLTKDNTALHIERENLIQKFLALMKENVNETDLSSLEHSFRELKEQCDLDSDTQIEMLKAQLTKEYEKRLSDQASAYENEYSELMNQSDVQQQELAFNADQIQQFLLKIAKLEQEIQLFKTSLEYEKQYREKIEQQMKQMKQNSRQFIDKLKIQHNCQDEKLKKGRSRFLGGNKVSPNPSPRTPQSKETQNFEISSNK